MFLLCLPPYEQQVFQIVVLMSPQIWGRHYLPLIGCFLPSSERDLALRHLLGQSASHRRPDLTRCMLLPYKRHIIYRLSSVYCLYHQYGERDTTSNLFCCGVMCKASKLYVRSGLIVVNSGSILQQTRQEVDSMLFLLSYLSVQ